jgi:DNA-binding transcriptional MerR regulator
VRTSEVAAQAQVNKQTLRYYELSKTSLKLDTIVRLSRLDTA